MYFVHVSKHQGGAALLRAGHRKGEEELKVITLKVSSCTIVCPPQTGMGRKSQLLSFSAIILSISLIHWQWEKLWGPEVRSLCLRGWALTWPNTYYAFYIEGGLVILEEELQQERLREIQLQISRSLRLKDPPNLTQFLTSQWVKQHNHAGIQQGVPPTPICELSALTPLVLVTSE